MMPCGRRLKVPYLRRLLLFLLVLFNDPQKFKFIGRRVALQRIVSAISLTVHARFTRTLVVLKPYVE